MSTSRPPSPNRNRVAQDADDIAGFFATRAGVWTTVGIIGGGILCFIAGALGWIG